MLLTLIKAAVVPKSQPQSNYGRRRALFCFLRSSVFKCFGLSRTRNCSYAIHWIRHKTL
jgi:hypothetical protein